MLRGFLHHLADHFCVFFMTPGSCERPASLLCHVQIPLKDSTSHPPFSYPPYIGMCRSSWDLTQGHPTITCLGLSVYLSLDLEVGCRGSAQNLVWEPQNSGRTHANILILSFRTRSAPLAYVTACERVLRLTKDKPIKETVNKERIRVEHWSS